MKQRYLFLTIFLSFCLTAGAEFSCSSEISYAWKRAEEEELKVFHTSVKQIAVDEPAAKKALAAVVSIAEKKAQSSCRHEHENLSGCLISRMNATAVARSANSFSARKEIEKAIDSDCKKQSGECKGASHTEAQCQEVVKPSAEVAGKDNNEKTKGKDKPKKK
jgi:hypothetical protein